MMSLNINSNLALAVEHPLHPVLVGAGTVVSAPEHLLKRHLHLATLRERLEQPLRLTARVRLEVDVDIVPIFDCEAHRLRRVGAHEHMTAENGERNMHHQILVALRQFRTIRRRRDLAHAMDTSDELSAEDRPVKIERRFR